MRGYFSRGRREVKKVLQLFLLEERKFLLNC